MRTLIVICCAYLAGCTGSISPSQLEPPAAALLVAPKPLAAPKEGDDLVPLYIDARRKYATVADRHRRLQRWVKTVIAK